MWLKLFRRNGRRIGLVSEKKVESKCCPLVSSVRCDVGVVIFLSLSEKYEFSCTLVRSNYSYVALNNGALLTAHLLPAVIFSMFHELLQSKAVWAKFRREVVRGVEWAKKSKKYETILSLREKLILLKKKLEIEAHEKKSGNEFIGEWSELRTQLSTLENIDVDWEDIVVVDITSSVPVEGHEKKPKAILSLRLILLPLLMVGLFFAVIYMFIEKSCTTKIYNQKYNEISLKCWA